jgi:hypothetical protein
LRTTIYLNHRIIAAEETYILDASTANAIHSFAKIERFGIERVAGTPPFSAARPAFEGIRQEGIEVVGPLEHQEVTVLQ